MIYLILVCTLNCTDLDQRNSELELLAALPILYPKLEIKSFQLGIDTPPTDASLFLLLSDSEILLNFIRSFTAIEETPILVISGGGRFDQVFYTENSLTSYFEALNAVINSQKMRRIGLIHSLGKIGSEILMNLNSKGHLLIPAYLEKNASQEKATELIGKFYKSQGITDYLVIVDESLCEKIDKCFSDMKLNKKWNIVIYGKECFGKFLKQGSLIIVPEGLDQDFDYFKNQLKNFSPKNYYNLQSVKKYLDLLTGNEVYKEQVLLKFSNRITSHQYSLVNFQNSEKVVVAEIANSTVKIVNTIIYLSGLDYREQVSKVPIRISANTGVINPPGYPNAYQNAKYHQGTYFALEKIKKSDQILNHFELELFDNITCGVSFFDYNYSKNCHLSIKNELGIAYIPSFYESTAQTIKQLKELAINTPIISGMGTGFESINNLEYTNFIRLVQPLYFCTYYDIISLKTNNWIYLNFFYIDDSWGESFYNNYLKYEKLGFISIVNDEKFRKIPFTYKTHMQEDYKEHFKNIQEGGCNVIVLAMSDPAAFFFVESFADYGIEYGEYAILFKAPNVHDAATAIDGNYKLRKKLLNDAFYSYFLFNDGEYGEAVKREFKNSGYDGNTPEYYIDTITTIKNAIEYLLAIGKDYEDPNLFIDAILTTKFNGVTGRVSFDLKTRLRESFSCNFYNVYFDEDLNEFKTHLFVKLNPFSTKFYTIYRDGFKWVSKCENFKNLKLKYFDCPYFTENIVSSEVSSKPELIINIILFGSSILAVFFIYKNIKIENLELLRKVSFIDVFDIIQMIFAISEPLQMITIGPQPKNINHGLYQIISFISMNLLTLLTLRSSNYWIFYYLTLSFGYFWLLLCLLSLLSKKLLKNKLEGFQSKIANLKAILAPFIIHYLFIPTIYTASSIFSCRKTEKRNLEISFLDLDCNFKCWTITHYAYITLSVSLIINLSSMAIIYRANSNGTFRNSNLKSNGKFVIIQNIASLFVVSHSKIVEKTSELAFALVFLVIIAFLLIISFKYLPYNYDRINLWIRILFSCIIWHDLIIIIELSFEVKVNLLNIIYFSGWALLFFLGVCLHLKLPPSLLLLKEGRTILQILRLAYNLGLFKSHNLNIDTAIRIHAK